MKLGRRCKSYKADGTSAALTTNYYLQVWAGKEGCEPVTWQECKLVDKTVHFRVPEVNCTPKQELWYHVPEPVELTRMTNTFSCKVSSVQGNEFKCSKFAV